MFSVYVLTTHIVMYDLIHCTGLSVTYKRGQEFKNDKSTASGCWARLFFSVCLCPRSRSHEGQGQIFIVQCEGLVTRVNVCEYEQNPSRDKEVMTNIKVFARRSRSRTRTRHQGYDNSSNFSSKNRRAKNKFRLIIL